MSVVRVRWARVAAVLLCGCGPLVGDDEESGGDADGTSGDAQTTGATMTAGTSVGTSVGTTDTTSTTTGPAGCAAEWVPGCQAYCAVNITCHPEVGTYEDCVVECMGGFAELTPECQVAWCEAYTCVGALDCASFDNGTPECDALGGAAEKMCGGADEACIVGAGSDGMCSYGCEDPPRRMSCDAVMCTCEKDGVPTGSCAADGICDKLDGLDAFATACCGW